jgi:hypothetical protein
LGRRTRIAIAGAVAALAALVPAAASHGAGDATALLTPIGMHVPNAPEPVLGGDGRMHLAYEIQIANQSDLEVTIDSVQALANGRAIGRGLDAAALGTLIHLHHGPVGSTLGPGEGATLFMDVTYPAKRKAPKRLRHQFTISFHPPGDPGATTTQAFVGVETEVGTEEAVEIEPPLRGERWLIGNGCCASISAHRGATLAINGVIYAPERFAIDFVQLTAGNTLVEGPYDQLTSWPFFGAKIHSVAPGRVVKVQDGLPEQVPGALPSGATVQTAGGNYVVVDIGEGRFAFYAHMQPGSIRVKEGQKVGAGKVLGLLGNSGNTDGPHLHFHVMDGPSPLRSNGLPFTFSRYRGQGVVTDEAPLFAGGSAPIDAAALAGKARGAMPLNDQLVKLK